MEKLNLPQFSFKILSENGVQMIFDPQRKKYIILQPEEWVRQNFTRYLLEVKQVPKELLNNEITININGMLQRCDSIIYTSNGKPLVIIEYKAPKVHITQKTFNQISRYNIVLKVPFLIISNGIKHFCCKVNYIDSSVIFMPDIPTYSQMIES